MSQKEDQQLLLVCPPSFFVERGLLAKDTYYVPLKAVYGFRRSPRLWGEHRDETLQQLEIKIEGEEETLCLEALDSELRGLLMTYVDDIMIVAEKKVMLAVKDQLQAQWTTSAPEYIAEKPVKFLGIAQSKVWQRQVADFPTVVHRRPPGSRSWLEREEDPNLKGSVDDD